MDQEAVVKSLLETNAKLTEQIIELSKALVEARQPAFIQPTQEFSTHPLWVPESEEDAMAAFRAGSITRDELEDTLKEIGFMNAELAIPTSL